MLCCDWCTPVVSTVALKRLSSASSAADAENTPSNTPVKLHNASILTTLAGLYNSRRMLLEGERAALEIHLENTQKEQNAARCEQLTSSEIRHEAFK
jgi:hypothetical protein